MIIWFLSGPTLTIETGTFIISSMRSIYFLAAEGRSSYFKIPVPEVLHGSLDIISAMTVAVALFSIGASFKFVHLKNDFKIVSYISFNKLILLPLIVFLLSTFVFKVETFDRNVMVILFATPLAVAAYIMAKELRSNYQLLASALILTTIISALTISAWLLLFKFI